MRATRPHLGVVSHVPVVSSERMKVSAVPACERVVDRLYWLSEGVAPRGGGDASGVGTEMLAVPSISTTSMDSQVRATAIVASCGPRAARRTLQVRAYHAAGRWSLLLIFGLPLGIVCLFALIAAGHAAARRSPGRAHGSRGSETGWGC